MKRERAAYKEPQIHVEKEVKNIENCTCSHAERWTHKKISQTHYQAHKALNLGLRESTIFVVLFWHPNPNGVILSQRHSQIVESSLHEEGRTMDEHAAKVISRQPLKLLRIASDDSGLYNARQGELRFSGPRVD